MGALLVVCSCQLPRRDVADEYCFIAVLVCEPLDRYLLLYRSKRED